ncbi:MAG: NCS2 family permease [Oscillospiraceae bacterium]|nr:NCS2 family permease [Oscillospiraceae bacterium]
MEKLFKLKQNGTNVKTELIAGLTTFLSMVYILAVNPSMLAAAGMEPAAVFTATAVSAFIACAVMAFFANYPIALASGMGLNAYFAYSVCVPMAEAGIQDPWQIALTAVLVEGIVFIILSLFKFRETLVNKVPANLKYGISAGIGLFIVIVGLKGAGIVVEDPSTLVALGSIGTPQVVLALVGFLIIAALHHYKVPGDILIGILATWVLGMIAQALGWYKVDVDAGAYSLFPSFAGGMLPAAPNLFKFNFSYVTSHVMEFIVIVFSFLFVDLFDTVGTVIGVADKGGLLDKEGNLPRAGATLMADAVGTVAGACLGTSTVTSYVESSAGVAQGGRTGLTALTTGVLFVLALVLSPIFLAIPGFATTPALMFVGLLMLSSVKKMTFDGDIADVVSGFIAIIMMPFTYSIANGIMFGILSWVILKVCTGKAKEIHPVMWIASALFVLRIITLIA